MNKFLPSNPTYVEVEIFVPGEVESFHSVERFQFRIRINSQISRNHGIRAGTADFPVCWP